MMKWNGSRVMRKIGVSLLSAGLLIGAAWAQEQGSQSQDSPTPSKPVANEALPLESLRTFADVFARIKSDYVEAVSDKDLIEHAIQGMLSGLDPHSVYLNEEEYKELNISTTGKFGGLGIEVGMTQDGYIEVISPIDDTPAQQAGIQAGDVILRLDGTSVKGMELDEAVKRMRGEAGSPIVLTIERKGKKESMEVTIVRDIIKVTSVKQINLGDGFGYIRISSFQANTFTALLDALDELKKANQNSLKGLILDLRNNPGGVLSAAVAVSDAFLTHGLIVYTEGRGSDAALKFEATPKDNLLGAPLVVLVNGGSASASEIVAGALQDHKRAVILGNKTFGKGSVQTILPLLNDKAVKLTTARYYTPLGRSIQAQGIVPDIEMAPNLKWVEAEPEPKAKPLTEADLSGHLGNGTVPEVPADTGAKDTGIPDKADKAEKPEQWVQKDVAVREAFNLLKGLYILRKVE